MSFFNTNSRNNDNKKYRTKITDFRHWHPHGCGGTKYLSKHELSQLKLFVGNLKPTFSSRNLHDLFADYGVIREAVVICDEMREYSKGYGFVTFLTEKSANQVLRAANNNYKLQRLTIHLASKCPKPRRAEFYVSHGCNGHRGLPRIQSYYDCQVITHRDKALLRTKNVQTIVPGKFATKHAEPFVETTEWQSKLPIIREENTTNNGFWKNQRNNHRIHSFYDNFNNNQSTNVTSNQSANNGILGNHNNNRSTLNASAPVFINNRNNSNQRYLWPHPTIMEHDNTNFMPPTRIVAAVQDMPTPYGIKSSQFQSTNPVRQHRQQQCDFGQSQQIYNPLLLAQNNHNYNLSAFYCNALSAAQLPVTPIPVITTSPTTPYYYCDAGISYL